MTLIKTITNTLLIMTFFCQKSYSFDLIDKSSLTPVKTGKIDGVSEGKFFETNSTGTKTLYLVKRSGERFDDFGEPFPFSLPPKYNVVKETCVADLYSLFIGPELSIHDDLVVDHANKDNPFLVGSRIIPNLHTDALVPPGTTNIELTLLVAIFLGEADSNSYNYGIVPKDPPPPTFYKLDHGFSLTKFDDDFEHIPRNKAEFTNFIKNVYTFPPDKLPDSAISEERIKDALHKIASVPDESIYQVLSKCVGFFDKSEFDEKNFYLDRIYNKLISRKRELSHPVQITTVECPEPTKIEKLKQMIIQSEHSVEKADHLNSPIRVH